MDYDDDFDGAELIAQYLSTKNRPIRMNLNFADGLSSDVLLPQRINGIEAICDGIEMRIYCVALDAALPLKTLIGLRHARRPAASAHAERHRRRPVRRGSLLRRAGTDQGADIPITLVCHSQGNMIGMAAAFFGDAMAPVRDNAGIEGRCVADTYVLCNPPYSLASSNVSEDWSQSNMKDKHGGTGRQSKAARIATLRAFFDIIRQPASRRQKFDDINQAMQNINHPFEANADCQAYGNRDSTCGRVTLYCNPHDHQPRRQSHLGGTEKLRHGFGRRPERR